MNHRSTFRCRAARTAVVAALVLVSFAAGATADTVRLHAVAGVRGDAVRLGDVAELTGDAAQGLADTIVATFAGDATELRLSLATVRDVLDERGVNWGLMSLKGYAACRVSRLIEAREPTLERAAAAAPNPETEVRLDTALTLRGQIEALLAQMAGVPREDLRFTFSDRDAEQLAASALHHRFEIEPMSTSVLGRVPVRVRRYTGGQVAETFTVTVDVARRALALVATRTISRDEPFTAGSVQVREVYLDDDRGEPLADASLIVGQQAAAVLREGGVIYPEHVRSPVLVKRGELITVRCLSGNLVVRTVGRAAQDGALDQVIPVRNEGSRETFYATVTGRREAVVGATSSAAPEPLAAAPRGEK